MIVTIDIPDKLITDRVNEAARAAFAAPGYHGTRETTVNQILSQAVIAWVKAQDWQAQIAAIAPQIAAEAVTAALRAELEKAARAAIKDMKASGVIEALVKAQLGGGNAHRD